MKIPRTPPRWVRWTLVSLIALVGSLAWGVTTASVESSLGPHRTTYAVSVDGQVTVDLGPLGTLEIDSPLPVGLGVDVVVGEIPDDVTAIGQAQTLEALSGDLNSYLQFFAGPDQTFREVGTALAVDALWRSLTALAVVSAIVVALALLLGAARRAEVSTWMAERTWVLSAVLVVVVLVAGGLTAPDRRPNPTAEPPSPVFQDTPLEGVRITGRLAGVINTYGVQLLGLYQENVDFYGGANTRLASAWDGRDSIEDRARDGEWPSASPDPAGTPSPSASPVAKEEDLVTFLVVSDLHCNTGMAPLIATAVERSGADVVLNAGDTTVNGTSVESFCVTSFASAVPRGVPVVVSDGNHDSTETSDQERGEHQKILDGEVITVAGVRILGDRDALETRIGQGSSEAREETPTEQAERLAETACEDEDGIDLLLVHSPRAGDEALESGCVPLQVSGHTHVRSGPEPWGQGIRYVNASTAGAASGQPTVGPLRDTAEMTVLRFDPASRRFVDWQLIEVRPDGSAGVGPRERFPEAERDAEDADTDGDPDGPDDPPQPTPGPGSEDVAPGTQDAQGVSGP